MRVNKAYLLQLTHEGQQRGKNLPTADKLWLVAMFVALGCFITSGIIWVVTFFNPLWEYMMLVLAVVLAAIPIAYLVWVHRQITRTLRAREAAGIPSDPPTPADEFRLVYGCWAMALLVVGGAVAIAAMFFLPSWARPYVWPGVLIGVPLLAQLGATLWVRRSRAPRQETREEINP